MNFNEIPFALMNIFTHIHIYTHEYEHIYITILILRMTHILLFENLKVFLYFDSS